MCFVVSSQTTRHLLQLQKLMALHAVKTTLESLSRRLLGIQDCFPQGSSLCFPMILSDFWGQLWTQEFCPHTFLLAVVGPGMTVGRPTQGSLWPFTSPSQHKLIPNFWFWKHHYGSVGNRTFWSLCPLWAYLRQSWLGLSPWALWLNTSGCEVHLWSSFGCFEVQSQLNRVQRLS